MAWAGPSSARRVRTRVAVALSVAPSADVVMAPPSTSTTMPSARRVRSLLLPSSSLTLAVLSS